MKRIALYFLLALALPVYHESMGQGTPYSGSAIALPGKLEFENYNLGGEGIGYHDITAGNAGGSYRSEDVDIEVSIDLQGGYNIGWTDAGEWLAYTVDIANAGLYNVNFRYATPVANQTVHLEMDGVNISGTIPLSYSGGWQSWKTYSINELNFPAGIHQLKIFLETGGLNLNYLEAIPTPEPPVGIQSPYGGSPFLLPGILELENYDLGGEGIAYHDLTIGNNGNAYRNDDVDIESDSPGETTPNIGWTNAGEWLEYTVHVDSTSTFDFNFRYATPYSNQAFHISIDNINSTGSLVFPATGGYQNWQFFPALNTALTVGDHVLRLYFETGSVNVNYLRITKVISDTSILQTPYGGIPLALPGRLEFENYDIGGEGIAYHDLSPDNSGNTYRFDDVDIEAASGSESSPAVAFTDGGEWMEYTVNVSNAGQYNFKLRYSTPLSGQRLQLEIDKSNVTGSITVPASGSWQDWATLDLSALNLTAGSHIFRVYLQTGGINLNYLDIAPASIYTSNYVVTNLGDAGVGSLRAAIDSANARPDYTKISFNIPGPGPYIIKTEGNLTLYYPAFIDGSSQPGYNSLTKNPVVQVSNNINGAFTNFEFAENSKGSEIKGMYLQNAGYFGIWLKADSITVRDNVINFIRFGTVYAVSCIGLYDAGSYSTIVGNVFHTDSSGTDKSLFYSDSITIGVYILSNGNPIHDVKIGGTGPGEGNTFAFENNGVIIDGAAVSKTFISGNTFKSILESNIFFVTENGTQSIPAPTFTSISGNIVEGTAVSGDTVQLYLSNEAGIEALRYIGSTVCAGGFWTYDLSNISPELLPGDKIIAVAIDATGNTSKFSSAFDITVDSPQGAVSVEQAIMNVNTVVLATEKDSDSGAGFYMSLFPNPAQDILTFTYRLQKASVVNLSIFDMQGKPVKNIEQSVSKPAGIFSISVQPGLAAGSYYCQLEDGNNIATKQLIIVK